MASKIDELLDELQSTGGGMDDYGADEELQREALTTTKAALLADMSYLVDSQFGHGKSPNETQLDIHKKLKEYYGDTNG